MRLRVTDAEGLTALDFADVTISSVTVNASRFLHLIPGTVSLFQPAGSADEGFIQALYRGVLGRDGEAAGMALWLAALSRGTSRLDLAASFWNSLEHRTNEVKGYYRDYLRRLPDGPGLSGWVNSLLTGALSEEKVAIGILSSPECMSLHPSDTDFVNSLYVSLLGRARGAGEAAAWEPIVQTVGRASVVATFLTAKEAWVHALDEFYSGLLDREGDLVGRQGWLAGLGSLWYAEVAIRFTASDEFFAKASAA